MRYPEHGRRTAGIGEPSGCTINKANKRPCHLASGKYNILLWEEKSQMYSYLSYLHMFQPISFCDIRTSMTASLPPRQPNTGLNSLWTFHSPLQLLHGHGDLEVVTQNVESREDVCPLDHLAQRTPLQHFGAEDISRLLRQEAHVDQDLRSRDTFGTSTPPLPTVVPTQSFPVISPHIR